MVVKEKKKGKRKNNIQELGAVSELRMRSGSGWPTFRPLNSLKDVGHYIALPVQNIELASSWPSKVK